LSGGLAIGARAHAFLAPEARNVGRFAHTLEVCSPPLLPHRAALAFRSPSDPSPAAAPRPLAGIAGCRAPQRHPAHIRDWWWSGAGLARPGGHGSSTSSTSRAEEWPPCSSGWTSRWSARR